MIHRCVERDFDQIYRIVNDAAQAYKGVIPVDRWRDPYMPKDELREAIEQGVEFWGCEADGELAGVMGMQRVRDVTLIRHAYVLTSCRRQGIGGRLLRYLHGMAVPGQRKVYQSAVGECTTQRRDSLGFSRIFALSAL